MIYKRPHADKKLTQHCAPSLEKLPRALRLCVWNYHKCRSKTCREDFHTFALNTDIFLVQEIRVYPETEELLSSTPLHWTVATSFLSLRKHYPTGIATGCRVKPVISDFRDDIKEPFLGIPKMIMSSLINIEDTQLLVINVHAINFKGIKTFRKNLQHALTLLSEYKGPLIIAGDFNTWSRRRLFEIKSMASKLKMREVKFHPDLRSTFFGKTVDYIFYRGLKLKKAEILPVTTSDHNPMFADFELK